MIFFYICYVTNINRSSQFYQSFYLLEGTNLLALNAIGKLLHSKEFENTNLHDYGTDIFWPIFYFSVDRFRRT